MILKHTTPFSLRLTVFLLLTVNFLMAYEKPIRIVGTPALENTPPGYIVTVGGPNDFQSVQLTAPTFGYYDKEVIGMVKLAVKPNAPQYLAAYSTTVEVRIKTYNASSVLLSNTLKAFVVKHEPFGNAAYKDQDYEIFNNQSPGNSVYKIESTVESITLQNGNGPTYSVLNLPDNLVIESTIDYLRYHDISTGTPLMPQISQVDQDGDGFNDVFVIGWPAISDPDHYEVEYTYVNNYDYTIGGLNINNVKPATALSYDFKNNSTRVATSINSYTVPIIFDRGYFLCRYRAFGRSTTGPNPSLVPYYSSWSLNADSGPVSNVIAPNNPSGTGWLYIADHFEKRKNWQYNATFAEEAKRKDVINYADGSLRSRQTITKMNSDNTTIVGENVYDYTGRSAVNILPYPLAPTIENPSANWSFMYKIDQNLSDNTGSKYSKTDFDLDSPSNPCSPNAVGLKPTSGSSMYYSPNNPDKNAQQGFVPDAKKFPFTQTEFTPDNTGRIKKQGGVGPDHQLGTNRETKYIYGSPEQAELDRLFGSEVGYASHYQKNMVIDANGQVSITYLDMEGRTIATSLAGSAPPNMLNMSKQPATASNLESDMFNKDKFGNSESNLVNAAADAITFNKSIIVTDNTPVVFTYSMEIDKFNDPCLKPGVCFNCVYDYEMKLVDDCGLTVFSTVSSGKRMIGRFDIVGNDTIFNTSCYNPSLYKFTEVQPPNPQTQPLTLAPGVYYVSKTLKINKEARDFYLKRYLDPQYNGCIKSLSYFDSLAVEKMDTTGCNVKCSNCFKKLGTKDNFVSLGKGTEEEWEEKYEECKKLCGYPKSTCEIALAQLLADVSPNGQYGEYVNGNDPLSVFNASNLLPENIKTILPTSPPNPSTPPYNLSNNIFNGPVTAVSPPVAFWKNPSHYKTNQAVYLDKKGKRYKVMLTLIPNTTSQFNLPVTNGNIITNPNSNAMGVFQTNTVGVYYTWPENLANLNDFIGIWQPSFAKSLVKYHPEFCYYKDCEDVYGKKLNGDSLSSNDYDSKLLFTTSFQEAVAKQLIIPIPSTNPTEYQLNLGHDPANTSGYFGASAINNPAQKYSNYFTATSPVLTMAKFVSYTFKCGTQFASNQVTNPVCTTFCAPINASSAQITDMQNKEWNALKGIYYGEKQKLLYQLSNYKRLNGAQCKYYNACIGNANFDGYTSPMVKYTPSNTLNYASEYFNAKQPCNQSIKDLYANKEKRFGYDVETPDENELAYQAYLQTGKCPNALDLQNLMAALAQANKLTATSEPLQNHPALTVNLYNYINNATPPPFPYTAYAWEASVLAGNVLNMNVKKIIANQVVKFVQLTPPSAGFNWNNVKDISQFMHTGYSGNNQTFSCTAKLVVASVVSYVTINGLTDIKLDGCMFKDVCKPNDLAKQLQTIMNALKSQTQLFGSPVALGPEGGNTFYGPYLSKVKQLIGPSSGPGNFQWNYVQNGGAEFEVYDLSNPSCKIRIRFLTYNNSPATQVSIGPIASFKNIKSDYQNYFTMQAFNQAGGLLGTIKGEVHKVCNNQTTPISMGTCDKPDPASCKTTFHQNRKELEVLLKDILENAKYLPVASANVANVVSNVNLTSNLIGNFQPLATNLPSTRYFVNSNFYRYLSGVYINATNIPNDSLSFSLKSPCVISNPNPNAFAFTEEENDPCIETEYCKVWLKTNNKAVSTAKGLANIVQVKKLVGCGTTNNNNFTDFYLLVEYSTNIQNQNVIDTIFGSSCYKIQNCNPCKDNLADCCGGNQTLPSESQENPFQLDSIAVAENKAYPDSSLALYTTYTTNINNVNTNMGWTVNDTSYIQPQPLIELLRQGYAQVFDQFNYFVNDFDSTIDDRSYLKSISKFARDYGAFKNPFRSYGRYKKATEKYNQKAMAFNTPSLSPMVDTSFYFGMYLDSIDVYIDYLVAQTATSQAQTAPDFFDGRSGLPTPPDQGCVDLWNQYIIAYNQFYSIPANVANCPPPPNGPFSAQDFADRNYCCAPNYSNFVNYINTFYSTNTCPQSIGSYESCDDPTPPDPEVCASWYSNYVSKINEYNLSAWAIAHNIFLSPTLFSNPMSFYSQGYCNCVNNYINYLQQYINASANAALIAPVSIKDWSGCGPGSPSTCDETFDKYVGAIDQFVNWANTQINPFQYLQYVVSYDISSFTANGLCYCAPGYIAFLNSVINGDITDPQYIIDHLSVQRFCNPVTITCPNPNALDTVVSPPVPQSENPCVKYAKDLAKANAKNAYQQYIDAQTSIFITKYNNYCLGATENLKREYSSKEFHYTLYYYDQAGNLIKTVPPEGLDVQHYLSINSFTSANAIKIKNDRAYKIKTVLVNHGMPTTYEYNSLNQLIKQKMPDHEGMGSVKFRYDYGLDSMVTIASSHFPDAYKGYAVETETISGNSFFGSYVRGKVFESEDGSATWKQSNAISGSNIKKIQYIQVGSVNYGFAVGSDGAFMFTTDGLNWDYLPIHELTNQNSTLNDLYFYKKNNSFEGFVVGDNGVIIKMAFNGGVPNIDGSININAVTTLPFSNVDDNITDITADNSTPNPFYYITVLNKTTNTSKVYRSNGSSGASGYWQLQATRLTELVKVTHVKNSNYYFAAGADGNLLRSADGGVTWVMRETNTAQNFKDIYFANHRKGVAILQAGGIGSLYKTMDGGNNWTLMVPGTLTKNFTSLSPYKDPGSATIDKVTANGTGGLIKRITINQTDTANVFIGAVTTDITGAGDVNDVSVIPYDVTSNSYKLFAVAAGANGQISYCLDYSQNNPTWSTLTFNASLNYKKVLMNLQTPNSNPIADGLIMDSNGSLHSFSSNTDIDDPTVVFSVLNNIVSTPNSYLDMTFDWDNANPYNTAYLLAKGSNNVRFADLIMSNLNVGNPAPNVYTDGSPVQNEVSSLSSVGNNRVAVGSTGGLSSLASIITGAVTANNVNVTDKSTMVNPVVINDIKFDATSGNVVAAGNDGYFAEKAGSGLFIVKSSQTSRDISAFDYAYSLSGVNVYYVVTAQGETGNVFSDPANNLMNLNLSPSGATRLNDIAVKSPGTPNTSFYAVGDNGALFLGPNDFSPVISVVNGEDNINTVAYLPPNNYAITCGDNTRCYFVSGTGSTLNKNWYTNEITKIHFTDADNGYFVGKKGLIRHSADGGFTWKTVKSPVTNSSGSPIDLHAVYTTGTNSAVIGGKNNYIANVNDLTVGPAVNGPVAQTGFIWQDIDLYDPDNGFIVGTNTNGPNTVMVRQLGLTNGVLTSLTTPPLSNGQSGGFRAVHAFKGSQAGRFVAVGENKTLRIYNGAAYATISYQSANTLANNSVLGTNDIIYDIGATDNGNLYFVSDKSRLVNFGIVDPSLNTVPITLTPINNYQQTLGTGAISYINNSAVLTISIIDGVNGFIGGQIYNNPGNFVGKLASTFAHERGNVSTFFWYDKLGRMVISQNTKQSKQPGKAYSYTMYDALGRIIEVGEKQDNGSGTLFKDIFGTYVGVYYNPTAIDDAKLNAWIVGNGSRREVTHTYYDDAVFTSANNSMPSNFSQDNLRKRVASVIYEDGFDNNIFTYNHATHYSYDIHGNVKTVLQDNKLLATPANNPLIAQRFKRMDYDYDLISGKVNQVSYQAGDADAFYHRYEYDDDNRIVEVKTSRNCIVFETDAKYFYFKHGPLARVEYGHDKVQGMDYAYTLQGWIKGVNSDKLDPNNDIGKDGKPLTPNKLFAHDAMAYSLGYYTNDYTPIDATQWTSANRFEANKAGSSLLASTNNLFNGNIGIMNTTIVQPLNLNGPLPQNYMMSQLPAANAYKYDQLNRIGVAANFNNLNVASNTWDLNPPTNINSYRNEFEYDDNGNITRQKKWAGTGATPMDDIEYYYNKSGNANGKLKQNRLYGIKDNINNSSTIGDIETSASAIPFDYTEGTINTPNPSLKPFNNYAYDEIGNLKYDGFEGLTGPFALVWNVYGKLKEVNNSLPGKKSLKFDYDAMGNRVAKHVYAGFTWESSTFYVRDAQGNVMATYKNEMVCIKDCETSNPTYGLSYKLIERDIYGSSRCALDQHEVEMIGPLPGNQTYERIVGNKTFELSNHLGNVISVVSDRKIPIEDGSNLGKTKHYIPQILSATDYYAFGEAMPDRKFNNGDYRYGFNGKENDNETFLQDYGMRQYNPRLGRFFSLDPIGTSYPFYSPYQFSGNKPIVAIDVDGLEDHIVVYNYDKYGKMTKLSVSRFLEKGTDLPRDNDLHKNGADVADATQKVMIIHKYATGSTKIEFADKLTQEQQVVIDEAKPRALKPNKSMKLNFDGYLGKTFKDGKFQHGEKDYAPTPVFRGKPVKPGTTYTGDNNYLAGVGDFPGAGTIGENMKTTVGIIAQLANKNDDIQTIKIGINQAVGSGVSASEEAVLRGQLQTVQNNIIKEFKNKGLDKNIKLQIGDINIIRNDNPGRVPNTGAKFEIK